MANFLRSAGHGNRKLGILRYFNRVRNRSVAERTHVFSNADKAAVLLDWRVIDRALQFVLGAPKKRARRDFAVNFYLYVGSACNANRSGSACKLDPQRSRRRQRSIKRTVLCGPDAASSKCNTGWEGCGQTEFTDAHCLSSARIRASCPS